MTACKEAQALLKKIHTWLSRQADRDEDQAITCRFESLKEAYLADAKNYRAVCKEIATVLTKMEGKP